jgi:hypothetical protein
MNAKKLVAGLSLAGLCGFVFASSQACTVTVGPGTPSDGGCDPFFSNCTDGAATDSGADTSVKPNLCNECLFGQCSGQWAVCQQSTSAGGCMSIYQCAIACSDQTCVNNCYAAGSVDGKKAYLSLAKCDVDGQCGTCQSACNTPPASCQVPDGGTGTDASVVQSCTDCTTNKCASQKTACAKDTDCDQYTQCLAVCKDVPCINACGLAHPTGQAASKALGDCTTQQCATECQLN